MSTDISALVSENLDVWTGSIERKSGAGRGGGKKLSLYGIERLRALILDLAVRGKLVPQVATDEPAPKLLARIVAERKVLQNQGKISKPRKLTPIDPGEVTAPSSWISARFGDLFSLEYGDNLPEPKRSGSGEYNVYGSNGIVGTHNVFSVESPCLVIGRKGSAGAINPSYGPCWVTDVAYYCVPPTGVILEYQLILFRTLGLDELGKGIKPGLNRNEAYALPVGIPSTAEQHRIIAKVNELMALCDALEEQCASALEAHQTLVETLLTTLVRSVGATELAANWSRLETHFDTLFTTEASIDALKQTVLELAVRGCLVPHNESDQTVVLPIFREVAKSSEWDEKVFIYGSKMFVLPDNWIFAPLAQLASHIVDCPHTTPKWTDGGDICVRTNQIKVRYLDLSEPNYVSAETYSERIERLEPASGDILYIREGGILGVGCKIPEGVKLCLGQRSMLIRCDTIVVPEYIEVVLNSQSIVSLAKHFTTGGAAPRVNMSTVRGYPIPTPPFAEQQRIVAKVDELTAFCDGLKARLSDAAATQKQFTDAIVERAAA